MDTGGMTLSDILYHGRYHLAIALILLVLLVAVVREVVRQIRISRVKQPLRSIDRNLILHDRLIGPTMTDGGETARNDAEDATEKGE